MLKRRMRQALPEREPLSTAVRTAPAAAAEPWWLWLSGMPHAARAAAMREPARTRGFAGSAIDGGRP